jgi:hypothetical protein
VRLKIPRPAPWSGTFVLIAGGTTSALQIYNRIAEEEFKTQGDNMSMIENIVG